MNQERSKYFDTAAKMDQALLDLMERKDFEYITVSELCKSAGVNRSTFYLHYENTMDLLHETIRYLIDDFLSCFSIDLSPISTRFQDCGTEHLIFLSDEYVLPYLRYIQKRRRAFATAVKHSASFEFEQTYQRMYEHIFNPILDRFHLPVENRSYIMAFYLNGIHAIVMEWLRRDCADSPEHICRVIRSCILNGYSAGNTPSFAKNP